MLITKEITIDLQRRGVMEPVEAVQCDANTRAVKVTLLNGGESWTPPAGAVASVAFKKPDGTAGWYNKLPDEADACTVAGNTVTAIFAPQMLTAAGKVNAAVIFQDAKLNQLATFVFTVNVQANPAAGKGISNDYYKYATMEQMSAAVDAWLTETEAEKNDFLSKADAALEAMRDVITASDGAPPIVCQESGENVSVSDSSDRPLRGLTLYGKTTQNGTPTPASPVELVSVGNSGAIKAMVTGKNLADVKLIQGGTAQYGRLVTIAPIKLLKGVSYTVSFDTPNTGIDCYVHNDAFSHKAFTLDGKRKAFTFSYASNKSMKVGSDGTVILISRSSATSNVNTGYISNVQIEMGASATDYEPYKGQSLTATTPNGLPGIPVTSGGNYTDENGQQWICDEVDFARGVYAKYVDIINGYAGESIFGPYISTTGDLTAGAKVLYALTTPIETALSAEEMVAYYALHSNKPNTVAFNDAGAGMKLAYVADTKLYIDNKFGELAAALVNKT